MFGVICTEKLPLLLAMSMFYNYTAIAHTNKQYKFSDEKRLFV